MAYASYEKTFQSAFSASSKAPSPSIQGIAEAKLVSQWSAARARGERVSREPPSLTSASAEKPNAPDITPTPQATNAVAPPEAIQSVTVLPTSVPIPQHNPAAVQSPVSTATSVAEQVTPEKKKPWWKFGGN